MLSLVLVVLCALLQVQGTTISLTPEDKACATDNNISLGMLQHVYFLEIPQNGGDNFYAALNCIWKRMGIQNDNGEVDFTNLKGKYESYVHILDLKPKTTRPVTDNQAVLQQAADQCHRNLPYGSQDGPSQKAQLSFKCFREEILKLL